VRASIGGDVTTQHGTIRLAGGRTLGYTRAGAADGRPVFVMEGPGSQLTAALGDAAAERCGVRLIAADRPGFGASTPVPEHTVRHWPSDVAALADALDLGRFGILAVSGGTPFAVATANRLSKRVNRLAVVAGMAPLHLPGATDGVSTVNRLAYLAARRAPGLVARWAGWMHEQSRKDPAGTARRYLQTRPGDAFVLDEPERARIVEEALQRMWAAPEGYAAEMAFLAGPWGVNLHRLPVPTRLWYGSRDTVHPPGMGKVLALRIPQAQLTVVPGASSLTFLTDLDDVLRWLVPRS
jgi:pimeloyl-ACP methyl ester carboxylesterase